VTSRRLVANVGVSISAAKPAVIEAGRFVSINTTLSFLPDRYFMLNGISRVSVCSITTVSGSPEIEKSKAVSGAVLFSFLQARNNNGMSRR